MKSIHKIIAIALGLFMSSSINAQVSFSAGTGMVNGFGGDKSYFGLHGGIELPRNNDVTFYGRFGHYFSRSNITSQNTSTVILKPNANDTLPYQLQVYNNSISTFNYTTIEGGTRYYLGNDYDNGFSAYGGTNFMLVFNSVKTRNEYENTDISGMVEWENDYEIPTQPGTGIGTDERGVIIGLAVGLQGGLKYTIPAVGTAYFDVSGQYSILGQANNATASNTNQYSQLFFVFTVGFRKDLY